MTHICRIAPPFLAAHGRTAFCVPQRKCAAQGIRAGDDIDFRSRATGKPVLSVRVSAVKTFTIRDHPRRGMLVRLDDHLISEDEATRIIAEPCGWTGPDALGHFHDFLRMRTLETTFALVQHHQPLCG